MCFGSVALEASGFEAASLYSGFSEGRILVFAPDVSSAEPPLSQSSRPENEPIPLSLSLRVIRLLVGSESVAAVIDESITSNCFAEISV